MPPQSIDYGRLVERALRNVVRDALEQVATHGLPGRHHLYITFRTDHPAVVIDDSLRARYPAEMTIVLQHQFWDLEVGANGFVVGLSFSDVPHRLEVPFEAVTVFADPSVEFGLQLGALAGTAAATTETGAKPAALAPVSQLPTSDAPREPVIKEGGADVVALDRFRKK
jgi:uncharacterized protein